MPGPVCARRFNNLRRVRRVVGGTGTGRKPREVEQRKSCTQGCLKSTLARQSFWLWLASAFDMVVISAILNRSELLTRSSTAGADTLAAADGQDGAALTGQSGLLGSA